MDLTKLSFASTANYLKRSDASNSGPITLGGSGATSTFTITHNLGYVPFFIAGAELVDAGIIWSNNYVHEFTESSQAATNLPVTFQYWCTSTTLTIEITNGIGTGVQSGSRNVYGLVYLDYEGA